MGVLKLKVPLTRDVVIPSHSANLLLDCADGNAALLYIYILAHSGELDTSAAEKRLKMSAEEMSRVLSLLEARGLIGKTEGIKIPERSDAVPEYSSVDVAEHLGSDNDFKYLVNFCEESLGKLLSTVDLQVLLGIYSWLGLPVDVICLLVKSCIDDMRKRYGPGRVPTMRTVEKRAKAWVRAGVLTLGRAEEYLREQEKLGREKTRFAELLRISGRALSPTEEKYISEWMSFGLSDELIEAAYDKTVVNTGSLKWSYMHRILVSWNVLGAKTLSDVEAGDNKPGEVSAHQGADESAAMRLRELNRKKRQGSAV